MSDLFNILTDSIRKYLQGASTSPSPSFAPSDQSDPAFSTTSSQLHTLCTSTLTATEEHLSSSPTTTEPLTAAERSPSSASSPCESLSVTESNSPPPLDPADWPALSDKVRTSHPRTLSDREGFHFS